MMSKTESRIHERMKVMIATARARIEAGQRLLAPGGREFFIKIVPDEDFFRCGERYQATGNNRGPIAIYISETDARL